MNKSLLKAIGPGILFASTAIGVSHLVQSTRAGAEFGFTLVWAIVLSNLFKFPFFQYASRYANATGTSIIDGYKKMGTWMLWLYFIITVSTMFFVCSAVGVVTSGFMDNLFDITGRLNARGFPMANLVTPGILFFGCTIILILGKYKVLDSLVKVIGAVLLISTIAAFTLAIFSKNSIPAESYYIFDTSIWDNKYKFAFMIALMGWMPTALDLSSWSSLWIVERIKQTKYHPTLKETLFDFNFGYIISAVLALFFVALGAFLMHETGEEVSKNPVGFGKQVIRMYTEAIGSWSFIVIAVAVFSIMFGTLIAVLDGYARSLKRILELLKNKEHQKKGSYIGSILILTVVSFAIMYRYVYGPNASKAGFRDLIDFTTTFSFMVAPIIAIVNFRLMNKKYIGEAAGPPAWLKILSYLGIAFLLCFSILKIITLIR
ncbi:MAG: Mn2+/Fe2+ NRAMP family transporter [Saprospiraceae bacterium]|jgi:Mn2+/Fe2+ NRAMP family transporter